MGYTCRKSTKDITISIVKVFTVVVVFSIVGDGLFTFKCILNLYWNNYFNSGRYFNSGYNVMFSLKFILNHYWNNYFNSGRYFNSGCNKPIMGSKYKFFFVWMLSDTRVTVEACRCLVFSSGTIMTLLRLRSAMWPWEFCSTALTFKEIKPSYSFIQYIIKCHASPAWRPV